MNFEHTFQNIRDVISKLVGIALAEEVTEVKFDCDRCITEVFRQNGLLVHAEIHDATQKGMLKRADYLSKIARVNLK
jgi:hypothetical protein